VKHLEVTIKIDWSDLDVYEHVNNVSIIRYLQTARVNFWELSGLYESYKKTNRGPMLVSTTCNFKKSLFYPGTILIKSRVAYVKNSSFAIEHIILNAEGVVFVQAKDVAVCFDFNTAKTFAVSQKIRTFMANYASNFSEI
jgi:acyl-CoA thioester hydrolase